MVPLTGYADRFSAAPGETIAFHVSSDASEPYEARLIRVICGDPNPEGPGIKEEDRADVFVGTYASRIQPVPLGSYARVPHADVLNGLGDVTVIATIWSTTSQDRRQGIVAKYDEASGAGFALYIDADGAGACVGAGSGQSQHISVGKPLRERTWYRVWATYDTATRTLSVGQAPLAPSVGADDAGGVSSAGEHPAILDTVVPLLIAALGGSPITGHFNGKIERPMILGRALGENEIVAMEMPGDCIAGWDFSREISSVRIVDVGPHGLDGEIVNLPARAMTGSNWRGEEMCWRHAPEQYGAIHFRGMTFTTVAGTRIFALRCRRD